MAAGAVKLAQRLLGLFALCWPVLNLLLVWVLLSQRLGHDGGDLFCGAGSCPANCNGKGRCGGDECECFPAWSGRDCSIPSCPNGCNGKGLCLPIGICMCDRGWVGADCGVDEAEVRTPAVLERLGAPFSNTTRFEPELEIAMTARGVRQYPRALCKTRACSTAWAAALSPIINFLPKEDNFFGAKIVSSNPSWPPYATCAIVSSAKQLVRGWSHEGEEEPPRLLSAAWSAEGHGKEIDVHDMVLRFDNAPTQGYERFTGRRTTHRLVSHEYARMVYSMLGAETVVDDRTKSVVTPSTWWAGGYPTVERVTYIMSTPPTGSSEQLRPPDPHAYTPFPEIFPGNKHVLLSPMFLRRVTEVHARVASIVRSQGYGCYKGPPRTLSPLLIATVLSLQVCGSVDVYGAAVGGPKVFTPGHRRHDGGAKVYGAATNRRGAAAESRRGDCCYYDEGYFNDINYAPDSQICDDLTCRHLMRFLVETGRVKAYL
eukprot:jgi/Chlat1/8260/Chrsp78S07690